ncbi:hypothetical protein BDD21_1910 [Thiocapsa rosea]|uniref:Uncharacterized protein n=1 Tax=Thiocapsa rosea TaxID=69360 RepID=A0A495V5H5_9GAMM|nr:hypothetical protein BDD21_1910 [Thiocapsa rosea]
MSRSPVVLFRWSGDSMFTPSSLQKVSQPIGRFPPMGPLGCVPHAQRYYQPTLTAQSPSRRTSLPSLGATLPSVLFAPVGRTSAVGPGRLLTRCPRRVSGKEQLSAPRFLDDPCVHALLLDPGGVSTSGRYDAETVAFRCSEYVGSAELSNGAPSHGLHAPCVRFAGGIAPAPHNTRFRWMATPYRLGTCTRWVAKRSFRLAYPFAIFLSFQALPGATVLRARPHDASHRTKPRPVRYASCVGAG